MKIRLYNARIMTMAEDCRLLEGEIWVEDDKILYIGDGTDLDPVAQDAKPTAALHL